MVLGCDANAHHMCWGTNVQEESLLDYIVSTGIQIGNLGNEPTFLTRVRGEMIDLTLFMPDLLINIQGWLFRTSCSYLITGTFASA